MPSKSKSAEPKQARPFLKGLGAQPPLLAELVKRLPRFYCKSYHEPFLGGGALFFELAARKRFERAYLSDLNEDVVNGYVAVQTWVEELIASLKKHAELNSREYYRQIFNMDAVEMDVIERASRFIYLNQAGGKKPLICDENNLRLCSEALKGVTIRRQSYYAVMRDVTKGDFIYFDPPYYPVSKKAARESGDFRRFGEADHRRLKDVFEALDRKKCFVLLSNSCTPFVKRQYKDYKPEIVEIPPPARSADSEPVKEIIVRNY